MVGDARAFGLPEMEAAGAFAATFGRDSTVQAAAAAPSPIVNGRTGEISLGRECAGTTGNILSRPRARADIDDALRQVQGRILAAVPADGHTVIAVCSAMEGEGKTTVAVALAEMLADQFGRRVLLVDGNLDVPQVHSLLGTHASPGLRDCLSEGAVITRAMGWTGRLWVLPAGVAGAAISEGGEDVPGIFRMLRALFQITIVDLPAISSQRNTALLPHWADGVVWVVRADTTPAELVQEAMETVGRESILGVVLNGHRSRLPGWLNRIL